MHPLVATGHRQIAMGLAIGAIGLGLALAAGGVWGALCFAVFAIPGAFYVWAGRQSRRSGIATPFFQDALIHLTNGELDEAERSAAELPPAIAKVPTYARMLRLQRALIALLRGDSAAAETLATESLASGAGTVLQRDWIAQRRADALAIRALARAASGNAAGVEEDVAAIDTIELASSAAVARSKLARAVILARSNDRAALAAHLDRFGGVILENVLPRERSLLRALRGLARSPGRSVYREPMRPDEGVTEAGKVRSWIAEVAPDAASFAPRDAFVDADAPPPRAEPAALRSIHTARALATASEQKRVRRALWWLIPLLLPVAWILNQPNGADFSRLLVIGVGAFFALSIPRNMVGHRRYQRYLSRAARRVALGDQNVATELRRLTRLRRFPLIGAGALHQLAMLANRDGRFLDAVAEADAGLAIATRHPTYRALTADLVMPGLIGERAFALAAMDRFAEAETELAQLTHSFPKYTLLASVSFRVRLVTAVRRKHWALAETIALSRRPELPLDLRADLLADVVLAEHGDITSAERDRIMTELRSMPEIGAWVDRLLQRGDFDPVDVDRRIAEGVPVLAEEPEDEVERRVNRVAERR